MTRRQWGQGRGTLRDAVASASGRELVRLGSGRGVTAVIDM